ncbi:MULTISPECIES: ferritin-like domain-containing protein [unclassified Paenibacillus]|uniref:ferritin-like domain-containing protein n=2 Tax=Paenibacillus TaxID=44249 RepID=UPI0024049BC5|nr:MULTISPECIES: ferritin-like domain-containing protein [unclassified Paenibacillus]MDH6510883.1 rubrerythrin [Paenibacillus sp. PastM-3]MDF9845024.1 rubrerythrin [Paenibacillus sp. PastF-2]MDF9851665.1 rubrerythrin [Paenibacillus sp. PastM-2]MDF9858249.1 rubrerythrin [Paenibacillus sp. PastF-1]MDH6483471.1 rubrerythrin [Paenibacillus sp. PastH-2]
MYSVYPAYGVYPFPRSSTFVPVWATSTQEALQLMKDSVQGERNDELFYNQLIQLAPDQGQVDVITSIRNDERTHNQMFRQMYKEITGYEVTGISNEVPEQVDSYMSGLQKAFQGELSAVEKYRKIWFGLPYGVYKDTLYGIILDEQKHAAKYNNLLIQNVAAKR